MTSVAELASTRGDVRKPATASTSCASFPGLILILIRGHRTRAIADLVEEAPSILQADGHAARDSAACRRISPQGLFSQLRFEVPDGGSTPAFAIRFSRIGASARDCAGLGSAPPPAAARCIRGHQPRVSIVSWL